ncbi:MAG: hypothetical protein WAO08_26710 [Hyphomicrobiaceae bacterium]
MEFVRQHPNWSAFIVFGLSLGESLPLVSLVLPFWAMLVGIGTIIAVADPLILAQYDDLENRWASGIMTRFARY